MVAFIYVETNPFFPTQHFTQIAQVLKCQQKLNMCQDYWNMNSKPTTTL